MVQLGQGSHPELHLAQLHLRNSQAPMHKLCMGNS